MALKRKPSANSSTDKHVLTMRDIQGDISKMAEIYEPAITVTAALTGIGAVIGLILIILLHGWLKLIGVIVLVAVLGIGLSYILSFKSQKDQILEIANSIPKGNFSILEDRIVKAWKETERLLFLKNPVWYIQTEHRDEPVKVPAVTGSNAVKGHQVYLVRDAVRGKISIAYLTDTMVPDLELLNRMLPADIGSRLLS